MDKAGRVNESSTAEGGPVTASEAALSEAA